MKKWFFKYVTLFLVSFFVSHFVLAQHPCLYVKDSDKAAIIAKINKQPWAKEAWSTLLKSIDPYVTRHQSDSAWIVSRMAMYWKDGEHYTQCYLKNETWDDGTGNAPVPTVRMPGMRTWNEYANVPLEDRTAYNETGDMKGVSKTHPEQGVVMVPYKKSGHLIRGNNVEILTLAEKASFVYWITGEEKYAKFAAAIFNTWLAGTYYMNPILDPGKSSGGEGGYKPGGILGYYDYEQIHDDLQVHAAATYDFLYTYLQSHQSVVHKVIGKKVVEIADTVFKRFINLGMVRGGKGGNWNVNGWNMMMPSILMLSNNVHYPDGRGKEYYLQYYTTTSTPYHDALPDILQAYDPVTGLWGESPGYALGTIASLLDMAMPLLNTGINTIEGNPIMKKAALSVFPWMDARGNIVNFGDGRGGPGNFTAFERLLTYYTQVKDTANAALVAAMIQKGVAAGQYNRSKTDWTGLCLNISALPANDAPLTYYRTAYSPLHRHVFMKNGNDEQNGLMATLYGGYNKQKHLSPNGLAMQLYGKGWALAPDASGYESYWSADYAYHQTATGSNTILPGYTAGPVFINGMEPRPDNNSFTSSKAISPYCSFTDMSAGEKRRMVAIIRTSATTGYYVDVFRSNLSENDYLYHNLGNTLTIEDAAEKPVALQKAILDSVYNPAYSYFKSVESANISSDIHARWTITATKPAINMDMWMHGENGREMYKADAPYSSLLTTVTPAQVNVAPANTPTIIIRQKGNNAWQHPFVSVFEPYEGNAKSIRKITALSGTEDFTGLKIESNSINQQLKGRTDYVLYSINHIDHLNYVHGDMTLFNGCFGVISEDSSGFKHFYLGKGRTLAKGGYGIYAADPANDSLAASLTIDGKKISYSANAAIKIRVPADYKKNGRKMQVIYNNGSGDKIVKYVIYDNDAKFVTAFLPAGTNIEIKSVWK